MPAPTLFQLAPARRARRLYAAVAVSASVLIALLVAAPAVAAGGNEIDFFVGPVIGSERVIGLGGAFLSIAEGVDGHMVNPAAFAVRPVFFGNEWFDWDAGLSTFGTVGGGVDFDMSGREESGAELSVSQVGFNLKFGRFGVGFHTLSQRLTLSTRDDDGTIKTRDFEQSIGGLGLAYALSDGEVVVGALIGVGLANIDSRLEPGDGSAPVAGHIGLASTSSPGTYGVLYAPRDQNFRIGAAMRLPTRIAGSSVAESSGDDAAKLTVPEAIVAPGSFAIGASMMFGERPYNIRPAYGDAPLPRGSRQVAAIPRPYVLVATELSISGPNSHGIGLASWFDGEAQPSGRGSAVSVRLGAESEIVPNRMIIRGGTYFEPSRFSGSPGRQHVTAGGDMRLTYGWDWRISVVMDLAPDYVNVAAGVGFWH